MKLDCPYGYNFGVDFDCEPKCEKCLGLWREKCFKEQRAIDALISLALRPDLARKFEQRTTGRKSK